MSAPHFIKLESSNIDSVAFNLTGHILTVNFKSGGTYEYLGVEERDVIEFIFALSPGHYFAHFIKPNYECRKVERVPELEVAE